MGGLGLWMSMDSCGASGCHRRTNGIFYVGHCGLCLFGAPWTSKTKKPIKNYGFLKINEMQKLAKIAGFLIFNETQKLQKNNVFCKFTKCGKSTIYNLIILKISLPTWVIFSASHLRKFRVQGAKHSRNNMWIKWNRMLWMHFLTWQFGRTVNRPPSLIRDAILHSIFSSEPVLRSGSNSQHTRVTWHFPSCHYHVTGTCYVSHSHIALR